MAEQFRIGEAVGERVGGLLHGCGAGFGDVIAADRNRIPARQVRGGELNHIRQKAQGSLDGENDFVLRLHFLQDIRLDGAAQFRDNVRPITPPGCGDIHAQDDRRGTIDSHRNGEVLVAERKTRVKPLHVLDRVDGHPPFANFAEHAIRVAVQPIECRTIESRAQPDISLLAGQVMEALVRVLGDPPLLGAQALPAGMDDTRAVRRDDVPHSHVQQQLRARLKRPLQLRWSRPTAITRIC